MKIAIINDSTVCTDDQVAAWAAACSYQLQADVCPAWEKLTPSIAFVPVGGTPDADAFQMQVKDDADTPGALGYHDVDANGRPIGYVFAKTTLADGGNVSTTLSHEMCEMFLDPSCTLWTQTPDGNMRALELCDAVESDEYEHAIGDVVVKVSNFLLPPYFSASPPAGSKFDFLGKLTGPAPARTPGGYDIVVDTAGNPSQEFSKHMAEMSEAKRAIKTHPMSRTAKRVARAA